MESTPRVSLLWTAPLALSLVVALCPGRALAQRPYGIDVYSGSGYITWSSVKNAGISFAWAKASEGTGYDDGQIINNINNARAAGVLIGAYHYPRYDLGLSATAEANYFWGIVAPYIKADGTELMPMLDVETPTSLSMAQVSAWVNAWCQQVVNNAAAAGITVHPVVYTYPWYCDTYLDSSVTQWTLWMADLNGENTQTGAPYTCKWSNWAVWQWSWYQIIPGVPGNSSGQCDEDVYNGTYAQLVQNLVIGAKRSSTDSYEGNDGNGNMQIYLPDAVNNMESDWQSTANGNWVGFSSFGGLTVAGIPAVGYNADRRMQVFVRDSTGAVWSIWKTALNGGWSAWTSFGGNVVGNITVGYLPDGSMQVFGRSPNNTVTTMSQTSANGGWSGWSDMGGSCYSDPVVGANADGRLEVFCRTAGNTMQTSFKTSTSVSAAWSSWYDFGGSVYGKLAVGNLGDGTMQLFARSGANTVQTIYQSGPNGSLGSWSDMGGSCYSDPVLAYSGDGSFRLFIRTSGNTVAVNAKANNQGGGWGGWTDLGGNCVGYLAAGNNADTRIQIFVRDSNYNVQSLWQTSVNGGWSSWLNMGGATPAVSISTQPASQNVAVGQNATFTVAANNALTYQWQFNGGNTSGATASSYTVSNAQTTNAGTYTVVAGNNAGSVTSSGAVLTVAGTPPTITTQPASQTVNQGQNATFSVVASGSAPLNYQWQFNGANLAGATASSYTVNNAQPFNAATYTVVVANTVGSVTSSNAILTVNATANAQPIPGLYGTGVGASGALLASGAMDPHYILFASADSAYPGPNSYVVNSVYPIPPWLADGPNSEWIAPQAAQTNGNAPGNYTYRLTFSLAGLTPSTAVIAGNWAADNYGVSILLNGAGTGCTNGNGFAGLTSFLITNGFNNGANTLDFVVANGGPSTNPTGLRVELSGNAQSVPPPIATEPANQTVCQGGSATFCVTPAATPSTYQWQFNGGNLSGGSLSCYTLGNIHTNKAGSYTIIVSNYYGVATSAVATLAVTAPPAIAVQPLSQVITQGGDAAFTVTAAGASPPNYQWQFNGNSVNGTLSSYSLGNVQASKAGAYTVVLSNNCNALTSAVAWLTLTMPLADQVATLGAAVTFTVTNCGGDPSLACQWLKNGVTLTDRGHVSGSTTTNLILGSIAASDAGTYAAIISNDALSSATVSAMLTVLLPVPGHFYQAGLLLDETLRLDMSGQPDCNYVLEATSNWLDWTSLTTLTSPNGLFQYTDPSVTNGGQRFYRLRLAP